MKRKHLPLLESTLINITFYAEGKVGDSLQPCVQGYQSIETALPDMFNRLMADAEVVFSGHCIALRNYIGPENELTGVTEAVYGGASTKLRNFLILATKWWKQEKPVGTSEHERFIRRALIEVTIPHLSNSEVEAAQNKDRDEFLTAMAMAIEGDDVTVLFQPSSVTT